MDYNPYSPPASDVANAIESQSSRPISVWLFLFFMLLFASASTIGLVRLFWAVSTHISGAGNYPRLATIIGWRLMTIILSIAVMVGIFRRKKWGCWIGVALLTAFTIWAFFRTDTAHYSSSAESDGGFLGQFVIAPLLLGWWIYSFGFSAKARYYFSVTESTL